MPFKVKANVSKRTMGIVLGLFCVPAMLGGIHLLTSGLMDAGAEILKEMQERQIPSVVGCVLKNDQVVWVGSYGFADKENHIPATRQSIYLLASLSKTVIATAVMQLAERGMIDIDADIELYLPFSVRNPHYPDAPITPRMLLTHSSSLAGPETDEELPGFYDWFPPDAAPPLVQTLTDYLLPRGPHYVPAVWKDSAPGRRELYSNLGATLLAYMVEFVSGEEFSSYCRGHIFLPLDMPGTSYKQADLDAASLAAWYMENTQPIPHFTRRDYPAGQVKSSGDEFSHFLGAWMNDGAFKGSRILNKNSVDEALQLHNPASGTCLIWNLTLGGWYGHSGGGNGASTYMEFHRKDKVGLIILSNMYLESDNPIFPPAGKIYGLIRKLANGFRRPEYPERNILDRLGDHRNQD
jgi:CubicO group peptidase (beta-lactamase class C family)